jgi:hypothetical protein
MGVTDAGTQAPQQRRFYEKPWFVVLTAVFGIAGTVFGIWSHFANIREPAITYEINPLRTVIVQGGAPSDLTVQYKGSLITKGVVSASVGIWNAGRAPIRVSDVLEPIRLKIGAGNRILSANVVRQSREIVQFQLYNPSAQPGALDVRSLDTLGVGFNILEHNDSAIVQIVYEGSPDADIVLSGIFVGQPKLNRLSLEQQKPIYPNSRHAKIISPILLLLLVIGLFVRITYLSVRIGRTSVGRNLWWLWFGGVASTLLVVYVGYQFVYETFISVPPFQFPG